MLYKVFEIEELIDSKANLDREIVDLMENNGSYLKVVSLKKHQYLEPHSSNTNVAIFVSEGELEIVFPDSESCTCQSCGCDIPIEDEDGKKYKVKKEHLFMFEKNVVYSIKALKDTLFLLIKI